MAEFPCDLMIGMEMGVARGMAAAPISRLLLRTGGYPRRGALRHTSVLRSIASVITHGFDSPEAEGAFRKIRGVHLQHRVPDAFVLYAMAGLVAGPICWIDRFGWRPLTAVERRGLGDFWTGFAERLDLSAPPRGTDAWLVYLRHCEDAWHGYSDANQQIAETMQEVFTRRLPRAAWPVGRMVFRSAIDRDLLPHLGWRPPAPPVRLALEIAVRCRGALGAMFPTVRRSGRTLLADLG